MNSWTIRRNASQFLGRSRLTARILFWVICMSVLIFSIVTGVTVLREHDRMYRAAREEAATNVSRNIMAISIALWNYDEGALGASLRALTQSGSIIRAEVRDPQQFVV